ncbi:MAG TPA: hypothetical protein VFP54_04665 [Acidimicrobiales bacterium]|nr:hypothetical protein [Acidimicrobiales bacterium]
MSDVPTDQADAPSPPAGGVHVVGADSPRRRLRRGGGSARGPRAGGPDRKVVVLAAVAVAGVAGTVGFAVAWATKNPDSGMGDAKATANRLVYDLTNFNASDIDQRFNDIQSLATGQFSQQAKQFFNTAIRQQLQAAQASTRGQVRYLLAQSYNGDQASFYADVDQTYANTHTAGPQVDEIRLLIDLTKVNGTWKISNLTDLNSGALTGPSKTAPAAPSTTAP